MRRIKVDPTDLQPGDIVVQLEDHELDGCHCDVVVTVLRPDKEDSAQSAPKPE